MYIPKSFPEAQREEIRNCFFGVKKSVKTAVFTPIRPFFSFLGEGFTYCRGWWETYYSDDTLISLIPQGSPSIDAISALEPKSEIIFIGFCGALRDLEIGEILEIEEAYLEENLFQRTVSRPLLFSGANIVTVGSLSESLERAHLLGNFIQCVDLETAYIYGAAIKQNKYARSIQIVSDINRVYPFFSPHPKDISIPIETASAKIKQLIT